jgi:Ca2+-transporting ATPase
MYKTHQYIGLTDAQVEESRQRHGANVLTPVVKESMWHKFLAKFGDPLIIILLIAGIMSIGISCYEFWGLGKGLSVFFEPIGIFVAIFLATGLAFIFEAKADKEFELLNRVNDDEPVEVVRNGMITRVARRDIVVGDIVILNSGEEIAADGTLLESVSLTVDESSLTGEPLCAKTTDPAHFDHEATFASNAVMRGTKVMEGHGVMQVTAVGDATENGKVYVAAQIDNSVKTPLDEQLDHLGKLIAKASYAIGIIIVIARIAMFLINQPFDVIEFVAYVLQSLMIAVTLVVVAVPEGLPMAVTLSLAYSMRRMLRTNNLVRKLHACETMGATTVICTDKTGTLTQNRMQIDSVNLFNGDNAMLHLAMAVNSTAQLDKTSAEGPDVIGNPTEGALLLWLDKNGIDYFSLRQSATVIDQLPFSTERKFMATFVETDDGQRLLLVKGAPEIVYRLCTRFPAGADKTTVDALLSQYQNRAMRTLAFAWQRLPESAPSPIVGKQLQATDLEFAAITAIADPVRDEAPAAVGEVINAGIKVKIVTGDNAGTAKEIGRRIGLWDDAVDTADNIITGDEFANLSDQQLRQRAEDIKIIARARPMDKKRLVEALQANNEVVAVTGDGTNDAPALNAAHVGLSMGDGTSVAKEASDITIIDNSFKSIGRAVMWGRSLYRNIQRFILFQLTVNVAACLIVLAGSFMGMESPLSVTQMLWVNLIMDTFAAMALAALPPTPKVMHDRPRNRQAFIINRPMGQLVFGVGFLFFILLLGLLWILERYDVESLSTLLSSPHSAPGHASLTPYELSLFFTVFVFLQFWNMFNARAFATGQSALRLRNCGEFIFIALVIFFGQLLIVSLGGELFNVVPLRISDWLIIILSTSLVLWIGEAIRAIKALKTKKRGKCY